MEKDQGEILLVEDNPDDEELALLAFKKNNISDEIHIARDGAEALEYLFGSGDGEKLQNPHLKGVRLMTEVWKVHHLQLKQKDTYFKLLFYPKRVKLDSTFSIRRHRCTYINFKWHPNGAKFTEHPCSMGVLFTPAVR